MRYKEFIPVEILYSREEKSLWGRIIEIWADKCIFVSKYDFRKYSKIYLSFEIENIKIENMAIKILKVEKDREHYFYYQSRILNPSILNGIRDMIRRLKII